MTPIYMGVDIAGASNTWGLALTPTSGGLNIVLPPSVMALAEIISFCDREEVAGVAIDAQLTIALSEENGFRASDMELRRLLPPGCGVWVASINSLMAVPVRGRMLADALSPVVGTVIETHPRASLLFALGPDYLDLIRSYKKGSAAAATVVELWRLWCLRYRITGCEPIAHDGALDALVCATVVYLFHRNLSSLRRLRHDAPDRMGHGPFYVIAPAYS